VARFEDVLQAAVAAELEAALRPVLRRLEELEHLNGMEPEDLPAPEPTAGRKRSLTWPRLRASP
jgi:hypothetical protein